MAAEVISIRATDRELEFLDRIIEYLQAHSLPGQQINRSDALRYAIEIAAIGIMNEVVPGG